MFLELIMNEKVNTFLLVKIVFYLIMLLKLSEIRCNAYVGFTKNKERIQYKTLCKQKILDFFIKGN